MELWMIRHGEAETNLPDEAGPALSPNGIAGIEKLAVDLKDWTHSPGSLFSSPLRRAQETAEILNRNWQLEVQTVDWLKPGVEPSRILKELQEIKVDSIAVVGHLPTLGWLASTLLWGIPPKEIILPKGSLTLLKVSEWEPSGAKIKALNNPEYLT